MAIPQCDIQEWQRTKPNSEDRRRKLKRILQLSAALPVLLSCSTWAAKWDVVPSLSVGEIYTDNVSLTSDTSKQSDWVTQVIPGISITAAGTGLQFSAAYNPEILYYARGARESEIFQRGNAAGTATLAEQLLFVDFGAGIDQYDASLQAPLTSSNVNTTGNRTSVTTYYASPYLRRDIGSGLLAEARFTASVEDSDDPSSISASPSLLDDSTAQRIDLLLNSGPAYKLLVWGLEYRRETIDYESAQDTSTEVATANVRRLITPAVGLLAQAGYEHYASGDLAPAAEGASWSAGFDWTPSPQTRLTAAAGHRFYGDAYLLDFSHRTRLTAWSAGYTQTVTTTRTEFFVASTSSTAGYLDTLFTSQYPDPAVRGEAVQEFIARTGLPSGLSTSTNFFTNELFLVKKWQASAGILGVRNVLIASMFKETSESLNSSLGLAGTGDFATSDTIVQTGMSILWNWRITAQDAWNLNGAYHRNEFPGTSRIDNFTYLGMGFTRQLQPRLFGSLNYRRQQGNSNASQGDYTENAIFATIQKRF